MSEWIRVTRQEPCPVCRKPDWCGVSADGVWCVCMRAESGHASRNGGWLHRLKDAPPPPRFRPPPTRRRNPLASLASYHAALRLRELKLQLLFKLYEDSAGVKRKPVLAQSLRFLHLNNDKIQQGLLKVQPLTRQLQCLAAKGKVRVPKRQRQRNE